MKFAFSLIALVIAALVIPFFIPGMGKQAGVDPNVNLPWQIETDDRGGSRVFGLSPGFQTLGEMRAILGADSELAIIARPDEVGSLEVYFNQIALGFVLAKMVLTVDASPEMVLAMRERALKAEHMESTTRKIRLHPDDVAAADRMLVRAVSVIPTVNLDEATIIQRFGQPGDRIPMSEKRVHLLYPEKGLDIVVDADGKELLQYVAPKDFALLHEPLRKPALTQ